MKRNELPKTANYYSKNVRGPLVPSSPLVWQHRGYPCTVPVSLIYDTHPSLLVGRWDKDAYVLFIKAELRVKFHWEAIAIETSEISWL